MLRWKIFIPLAIFLTILAIGGNYYAEAKLAGSGIAGINDPSIHQIRLTRQEMILEVEPGQLQKALITLKEGGASRQLVGRQLILSAPPETNSINEELRLEAELLFYQALATREFWHVGEILKSQAAGQGYQANFYVWDNWFLMEIYNSSEAFYAGKEVSR